MTPADAAELIAFLEHRIERDRKTVAALQVVANLTDLSTTEIRAHAALSPQLSALLQTLIAAEGKWVAHYRLMEALHGPDEAGWPAEKGMHVIVCHLRARLRKARVPYRIENKTGLGYRLRVA